MSFHIVLVEPEIPANTGNIARTCAATDTYLHLVHPLGFSTEDRYLKRAGLDYWDAVKIQHHDSFEEVRRDYTNHRFFYATKKTERNYTDFLFQDGDFLVFGKETKGLPEDLLEAHSDHCLRLPMTDHVRSLNLSNSVAVLLYEGLRQIGFPGMN